MTMAVLSGKGWFSGDKMNNPAAIIKNVEDLDWFNLNFFIWLFHKNIMHKTIFFFLPFF